MIISNKRVVIFLICSFLIDYITYYLTDRSFSYLNIYDLFIFALFVMNINISLFFSIFDRYQYSLNRVFWGYQFTFFSIIPFFQFVYNHFSWINMRGFEIEKSLILYAQALVLIFNLSYLFSNIFLNLKYFKYTSKNSAYFTSYLQNNKNIKVLFLTFLVVSSLILAHIHNFFLNFHNHSISLLFTFFIKVYLLISIAIVVDYFVSTKKLHLKFLALIYSSFILLSVYYNIITIGSQRHLLGALGFVLIFSFKRIGYNNLTFFFLLLFSIIIFSVLGTFRNYESINLDLIKYVLSNINMEDLFLEGGNFDAYTMFLLTIKYTIDFGFSWGYQFLGSLFFFVPRFIWVSKPIGSGSFIAEHFNFYFTNLSCPFIAEGYINFGIVGIIIFGFVLGYIVKVIDEKYWSLIKISKKSGLYYAYPILLSFEFLFLRGDLMNSFAFLVGTLATAYVYNKLLRIN